ncbi:hypothetical protein PAQU9191_03585 [Photobacterium aquimaris]|uniref:Uncharacterized protein n=1 Tax=Photobacterium aquimaris TaxID=512643 RepID=A0A1Y6L1P0_9GAMM|nr:hypothetical protein PAQU9191_03585 [Photobacterium aquimaris]
MLPQNYILITITILARSCLPRVYFYRPLTNDKKNHTEMVWFFINLEFEIYCLKSISKTMVIYGMALKAHAQHQQTHQHFQAAHQDEYHGLS